MSASTQNCSLDLDTRMLAEFLYALNIARRQILSYPAGHPVVAGAAKKLIDILPRLLEFRSEVTIGIARDTLMVGGHVLDSSNPVFRDLAKNLFEARVASLSINRDLNEDEVCRFFEIFRRDAEQLVDAGGLDRLLAAQAFKGIRAQGIDFTAFSATEVDVVHKPKADFAESETAVLWKSFVDGLTKGTLDPDGERFTAPEEIDPVLLAEVINRGYQHADSFTEKSYEEAITSFLKEADKEKIQTEAHRESLGRLGCVIDKLNPELRRRFLNSTLRTCANRPERAEALFENVSQSTILDAIDACQDNSLQIPQSLMDILGKLSGYQDSEVPRSRVVGHRTREATETREQLIRLFEADQSQFFVPKDYQDSLAALAAAKIDHGLDKGQVDEVLQCLEGHHVEIHFSRVLLDLLERGVDKETAGAIGRNMEELVEYFLETGDFVSLSSIHHHLHGYIKSNSAEQEAPACEAIERFEQEEFAEQVLDGLETWGKTAHPGIKMLIKRVGAVFADPLLNRLAEEMDMSKRRLFMDCLVQIGPAVREPVLHRLHDRRWFFVRNLVILLRELNDPSVLSSLGRLVGYAHPKVQYEVMATFLHFGDSRADRYLLKELESKDPGVLLNAVRLSGKSRDPEVVSKLCMLLNKKLPADHETTIKSGLLSALSEIGTDLIMPDLEKFLFSRKLLNINRSHALKIQAVKLLEQLGSPDAGRLAEKVYKSASGELARVAGHACLQINGKLP